MNSKLDEAVSAAYEAIDYSIPPDMVEKAVRAALGAFRDPSEEMVAALHAALDDREVAPAAAGQGREIAEAIGVMIDAALKG